MSDDAFREFLAALRQWEETRRRGGASGYGYGRLVYLDALKASEARLRQAFERCVLEIVAEERVNPCKPS
jgi:hypothetical protein